MENCKKYPINNDSFKNGPLEITLPGYYYFTEDIILNFYKTKEDFYKHNKNHNFGFSAGIIIRTSNVTIDLCNFSIKQSNIDYCLQRFFALIQLNNMPFNVGAGPILENRKKLDQPKNIIIKNGTFGLTSHQAILANNNENLKIHDILIKDFEVSGITLNNISNLNFYNSVIKTPIELVPLNPFFSAFVFMFRLLQTASIFINNPEIVNKINTIIDTIKEEIDSFIDIIISSETLLNLINNQTYKYFINQDKLSPCNVHGLKITGSGPSVNEFHKTINPDNSLNSKNIKITNVIIKDINAVVNEELALAYKDNIVHIGAGVKVTFNLLKITSMFTIIEQMKNLITQYPEVNTYLKSDLSNNDIYDVIQKIKFKQKITSEQAKVFSVLRNVDSMGHINKGVMGVRLGSMLNCYVNNLKISKINNFGRNSEDRNEIINLYNIFKQTFPEHGVSGISNINGSYSTAIISSSVHKSSFYNIDINNICSTNSHAIGFFINNESEDVTVNGIFINKIKSNNKLNDSATILIDENTKNIYIYNSFVNVNKEVYRFKYIFMFFISIVILYIASIIPFSKVIYYFTKCFFCSNENKTDFTNFLYKQIF